MPRGRIGPVRRTLFSTSCRISDLRISGSFLRLGRTAEDACGAPAFL
jgi:hypothetical protein